jgi:hypothetical protein
MSNYLAAAPARHDDDDTIFDVSLGFHSANSTRTK